MRIILVLLFWMVIQPITFACDDEAMKAELQSLKWVAEDYPPFNYLNKSGEITGIFTDILILIYQDLGLELNVEAIAIIPWARLYHKLTFESDVAGYSMTETVDRRKLFKLVSLPFVTKISIMAKEANKERLLSKDITELTIGVVREDIGHHLLIANNIKAVQVATTSAASMIKLLLRDRVDAIAYAEDVARFQFQKLQLAQHKIVPIRRLKGQFLNSYIFHRNVNTCLTDLFEQTVDKLNGNGELERVYRKYVH